MQRRDGRRTKQRQKESSPGSVLGFGTLLPFSKPQILHPWQWSSHRLHLLGLLRGLEYFDMTHGSVHGPFLFPTQTHCPGDLIQSRGFKFHPQLASSQISLSPEFPLAHLAPALGFLTPSFTNPKQPLTFDPLMFSLASHLCKRKPHSSRQRPNI